MYYEVWERFDENATQYIPLDKLSEFIDSLELPLRVPVPNLYRIIVMDIPICELDTVHCVDILDSLTKNFLGTTDAGGELGDLPKGPERKDYHVVSSTLRRQREIFVAKLIQRTWRRKRGVVNGDADETAKIGAAAQTIVTIEDVDACDAHDTPAVEDELNENCDFGTDERLSVRDVAA